MIVLMAVTSSTALAQEFGCNLIKPPIRALEVENHISGSSGEFKRSWETFERVSERGVSPRTLQSVLAELMKTTEKVSRLTDISLLDVEARLRKTEERLVNLLDNGSDVRISRESLVRDVYLRSAAKLSGDRDYLFEMAKWAREEGIRVSSCLTIGRRN
jgi:hypothetical protein